MEYTNQTDSILMTLLRTAMDNAQKKIQSITSPIECLIETSKFYELSIIQIDASLKLVKKLEDQIPETSQKKMIIDLIKLRNLLHDHMNNTKCLIIEKDKVLMKRLENEIRLKQALDLKERELVSLRSKVQLDFKPKFLSFEEESKVQLDLDFDQIKSDQIVMIKQLKSDIYMLKERLDLTLDQIDQTDQARCLDQQYRWLIEKETILITIKGYIRDQSLEYLKKDSIITRLLEEKQLSILQTMTMEEHYMVLLNDCYKEFECYDIESKVREDVFAYVFIEIMNDMWIKLDSELQKIQNEIHVMLKPLLTDFQENVTKKLHTNLSRLDDIKQRVCSISKIAASNQKEKLVYKKAFRRRCENLLLAETEVDLLGDQVEALQDLLQKIYFILEQNSSVLSHNFQVMDILKMIKKEF